LNNVIYCNCGDWVESCSALVEHHDGSLELLRWNDTVATIKSMRFGDREPEAAVPDKELVVI